MADPVYLNFTAAAINARLALAATATQPEDVDEVPADGSTAPVASDALYDHAASVTAHGDPRAAHEAAYDHSVIGTVAALGEHAGAVSITGSGVRTLVCTDDTELTFSSPASGTIKVDVLATARCISSGCLVATYRAADTDNGITAQAASFAGQIAVGTALRTIVHLIGVGTGATAEFSATLSDSSATDDPIALTAGWYLITAVVRAGATATLDWSLDQTNTTGSLYLSAIAVSDDGASGAAALTLASATRSARLDLMDYSGGDYRHYGRGGDDTSRDGIDTGLIGPITFGGDISASASSDVSVAFEGIPPATDYALTVAGEPGYSVAIGPGLVRLSALVSADGTRHIIEEVFG